MLRIAICDDEIECAEQIKNYLLRLQESFPRRFDIHIFTDGRELMDEWSVRKAFELVILDIQLGDVDGIELAGRIRDNYPAASILFMTGFHKHVYRVFDVHPAGFLRKPLQEEEVQNTLRRVLNECDRMQAYTYENRKQFRKILYKDILCVSSEGKRVTFVTTSDEITFYDTLENVWKQLEDGSCFWRIHKSVIINRMYIKKLDYTNVLISDGEWERAFTISQRYQPVIRQKYLEWKKGGDTTK